MTLPAPNRNRRRSAVLVLLIAASLVLQTRSPVSAQERPPFDLRWVLGDCPGCAMPWNLGRAWFTSRSDVWAVGAAGPHAGSGQMGYKVLLHTSDGGRTWKEVPETECYTAAPSVSFLNERSGWVETCSSPASEILLETRDAGRHWNDITGKFPVFPQILDGVHWWGIRTTPIIRSTDGRHWRNTLFATQDAGQNWSSSPLPYDSGDFPAVRLISPEVGWAATVAEGRIVVFRTIDGGRTWDRSAIVPPRPAIDLRDLFFLDRSRGWLMADFDPGETMRAEGSYVFATTDGGGTWRRQGADAFDDDPAAWVSFLSVRLGFAYVAGSLAYTTDAGARWHRLEVPNYISNCQALEGDFLCSASGSTSPLIVLTIHPRL